jgi:hypothetical protein
MGRASRRKRDLRSSWRRQRGESRESTEFRRHLLAEDAIDEVAGALRDILKGSAIEVQSDDTAAPSGVTSGPLATGSAHMLSPLVHL